MKNFKIVLTSLLLVASILGLSSFVSQNYKAKAFATTCFTYEGAQTETAIKIASNYTEGSPQTVCDNIINLCGICISDDAGIDENGLPKQAVLDAVWNHLGDARQGNGTVVFTIQIGSVTVTITIYFKPRH